MALVLTRFMGDSISSLGTTTLLVTIGEELRSKIVMVTFMVVRHPSVYNVILDRLTLNKLRAIISTYHRVAYLMSTASPVQIIRIDSTT